MDHRVVPMIHVPDVRATIRWYESVGFEVIVRDPNGFWLTFAQPAVGERLMRQEHRAFATHCPSPRWRYPVSQEVPRCREISNGSG
jgi:hypothetical protein